MVSNPLQTTMEPLTRFSQPMLMALHARDSSELSNGKDINIKLKPEYRK